jgi:hypothetical protein
MLGACLRLSGHLIEAQKDRIQLLTGAGTRLQSNAASSFYGRDNRNSSKRRGTCYANALCFAVRLALLGAKTTPQDSNADSKEVT